VFVTETRRVAAPYELNHAVFVFDCKIEEMHTDFLCILYYTILAVHVSSAICTHYQEHKLQSTAVGTCDGYGVLEVGWSIGAGCGWDTLTIRARAIDRAVIKNT
jgi:hypothetical protein